MNDLNTTVSISILENIKELWIFIIGFVGAIGTILGTYFGIKKIGYKIKAKYTIESCRWSARRVSKITLENKTDKLLTIFSIVAKINDKYLLEIETLEKPLNLQPLSTQKINIDYVSRWLIDDIEKLIEFENLEIFIKSNDGFIQCNKMQFSITDLSHLQYITKCQSYYNNKIYTPNVLFAIEYLDNKENHITVFVDKFGHMSSEILGFNIIPKEILLNKNEIIQIFKEKGLEIRCQGLAENDTKQPTLVKYK